MERDVGGTDGEEGGGQVFIVVEEKRRGSATRAFPDQASAKPGGSNRTTEITKSRRRQNTSAINTGCRFTVVAEKCISLSQIVYKVEVWNNNHNHGLVEVLSTLPQRRIV